MLSSPNCWCHMAQAGDSCCHQSTCQGSEEGSQEFVLEATGALGLGGCGEEWLGFQTHWFTEEPAREGQGAACLVIVIVLITLAGSEQDPTLRQVPHHSLPGICATIPAEHPARPGPCCAPKVAPTRCPHPVRHPGSLLGSP